MKTLYIDCGMGAAGDMLTAGLLELLPKSERAGFVESLNALGLPGVEVRAERRMKCGITGTRVSVLVDGAEEADLLRERELQAKQHTPHEPLQHEHLHHKHSQQGHSQHEDTQHGEDESHEQLHSHGQDGHSHEHSHSHAHSHDHAHSHHHSHSSLSDIRHLVREHFKLPEAVQEDVLSVYRLIAEAEGHVHGMEMEEIHFHEVGTKDALMDVAAVCLLMHRIAPDEVLASPVHVGSGQVHCAHGILPVPAPATAYILRDVPIYGGEIQGELCTPTGAALLKHFVHRFTSMPVLRVQAIGYGMGNKDFERANCVRLMLGEREGKTDRISILSCNVDDMAAEEIAFAMEQLFAAGAREVYTTPIGMKKSRPGTLLSVLCDVDKREEMLHLIFRHTTSIGIRETEAQRYVLLRREEDVETDFGRVRRKLSSGYGVSRAKYEYEDLRRIAEAEGLGLRELLGKLP